ncbi:MAG TPA: CPBP family intramembrane glutamic endopeptidase [Microlunatus sp.]|nr:CPBP family intramembrane glutamic endopeptidase [Microlunatus sp.]
MDASSPRRRLRTICELVADHPTAGFLISTFAVSYPVMGLIALAAHGVIPGSRILAALPIPPDEFAGLLLTLGALLPAALFVTWAVDGRDGVVGLLRRVTRWRFGWGWWLLILSALPVLTVAFGVLLGDSRTSVDPVATLLRQLPLLLINLLLVNLWEEAAWTGVLQTRLERRHNLFVAAAVTAVPFGFVHWPLSWLEPAPSTIPVLVALPSYVLMGLFVRPLFGLIHRGTGGSVLAVAVTHSIVNRTQNPNGLAAELLDGQLYQLGIVLALLVLTGTLALAMRHRLGRTGRDQLDGTTRHHRRSSARHAGTATRPAP